MDSTSSATRIPAWTFPVAPAADELLSSWLSRSAHLHGIAAYAFLSLRLPEAHVWNRDVDLTAGPSLLSEIDRVADLPPGTAEALTMRPVLPVLSPRRAEVGGHVPFLLSAGVHHRKRRLHGLQYCPSCLSVAQPAFHRWGRLAFVVACPRDGTPLRDGCPACDAPVVPHRAGVGHLGRCHACAAALAISSPGPASAASASVAALQARCLAALAAGATVAPELPCSGSDYLALVRSLVSVVTSTAWRVDAGGPSQATPTGPGSRRQIERMRVAERAFVLAKVSRWTDAWPAVFHERAADFGLTRRSFVRLTVPPILAAEVALLPDGHRRRRPGWRSVLDDAGMRRLRRADPSAYRTARARRLLAAAASSATI